MISPTRAALARLARPLRGLGGASWGLLALGTVALLLGIAAWLARLEWWSGPWWVLAAWGLALLVLAALATLGLRRQAGLSAARLAVRLEELGAWRRGALTGLLDAPAPGTSPALHAAADRDRAAELGTRGAAALRPVSDALRRQAGSAVLVLALGLAALGSAGPVRGPASALWHPGRAWRATVAPVQLRASATVVDRGGSVVLELDAIGRREATLWLRSPGEPWRASVVPLDSAGRARRRIGPLEGDLFARASSGSRSSDTVAVRVRLPAFLGTVTVTAHYPAYLGLAAEPVPTTGDTLVLPAGTRLETRGEATAALAAAAWVAGAVRAPLAVERTTFGGSFVPRASGDFRLLLRTAGGAALAGDTLRLPVRIVADSAPVVEIPVPGADTLAPLDLRVPLVLDVRDDHGLARVLVESRRISRLGVAEAPRQETVPLRGVTPDRAVLTHLLDLNGRGLLPGDTVRYRAVALDNAPRAGVGRSREFVLRLPTLSEVRAAQRHASDELGGRLDSLGAESRRLERQTEDLAREQSTRSGSERRGEKESLSYEQAQRAEAVAKGQDELIREAEAARDMLEALERSTEAAGLDDSTFVRRLEEVREQLDRALSPELRERLAKLQAALRNLDAEQTREALEQLAEAQRELRDALERSRELFRRAALEGDLANLAEESRELAGAQQEWNERVGSADSAAAAAEERALAERADSLAGELRRLAGEMDAPERRETLSELSEQAQQAAQQMREAGRSAEQGREQAAQRQGRQAAQQLQPIGERLARERNSLQEQWRREVAEAIEQTMAETSRLSERQLALQEAYRRGDASDQVRAEQGALEEGVQQLLEQTRGAAGKNALVPPQINAALAAARQKMEAARQAISTAGRNTREAAEQAGDAVDALNAATYQLVQARGDVSDAQSGSGLAEAMERMSQLAQQQGQLGKQSGGLLPMAGTGAAREQMRQLAARQRAVAEQIERLRAQHPMSGAGEMATEARELARRLESGRLDRQTVQRQERLFRRMLDAGRTLQGEERDEKKERQSTSATDGEVRLPPALRARLLGDDDRPRMPGWEELQRLSPEERRLVMDYFRRLAEPEAE